MIYTNNIEQTVKELNQKLNQELGSNELDIFRVKANERKNRETDGIIEIEVFWCLTFKEIYTIRKILRTDKFYVTRALNRGTLCIWCSYKKVGE